MSILIIAEAGVNHNGDMALAKKLIDVAAISGADLVKFQSFNADRLATLQSQKADYQMATTDISETQHEMLSRLELTEKMHIELIDYCASRGIGFFSSPFDIESVDILVNLGIDRFKVPSGEITNLPYLRHIGKFKKPIILSTGMATMGDIEVAIDVLEQAGTSRSLITVLHCTTEYPTPMAEINLRAMKSMEAAFGVEVGYSDHSEGIEVAIAAAALGATVIEKHFTLDKCLPGPDHKASLEPKDLQAMVCGIRNIEVALGDGIKRLTPSEQRNKNVARKSIVASKKIYKGEIFSNKNVTCKRPGGGMSPMKIDSVIGSAAKKNFEINDCICL